ncbi:DsrE family protein [Acidithiobacillus sp. AMEEHan]|uniref:DsrE family protein n=1 Tax=Acidithiobacillus sp. AMEEHan TaxID=2994951 RepID=UPI0027E54661|nr:DsrE family protein [Acidithiobacillus sp. AMEEHan]
MKRHFFVFLAVISLGIFFSCAEAAPLTDAQALSGLHTAKAVFLVNVKNPNAVEHLVKVIGLTRHQLLAQKVTPHFIVVFIGPDVAFLTKDRRGIPCTEERAVAGIQHEIDKLTTQGIQFQACGVALHGMDVHPSMVIPAVHPVESGFISVIAYQEKGYALVPVY